MRKSIQSILLVTSTFLIIGCGQEKPAQKKTDQSLKEAEKYIQVSPVFNADSAYAFVEKQVSFGPRVNNTAAHRKCGDWMVSQLKKYDAKVFEQKTILDFRGKKLEARNIIGSFNPKATRRIILCAHWDSRPYGDKDTKDPDQPIDGADDGGSGVGVLLEIARILKDHPLETGIDVIFFDAEDLGLNDVEGSWCLGSEYWSTHLHAPNYRAEYGILLDLVGASNPKFGWEGNSTENARPILEKVWSTAQKLGYGDKFIYYQFGGIEDDHYHVIRNTSTPTIDIINYDPVTNKFPDHHHTHRDNMQVISKETLKAVGQTVLEVLYSGDKIH